MHYGHFVIAHLEGHHKLVGLPEDRNTARIGESFWAYFVRATCGEYVDAWKYDWKSTKCKRIVAYHTLQAVVDYICFAVGGYPAFAFMMVQSVVAHMIVQTANYVTHYGITRKNAKEPITAGIAWEARHRFSGWLLLRLARHADHHLNPTRTYDALRVNDKSPTLPVAYTLLSFVAMFPPLWFALMNRRVLELRAQRI
jgi:alkane 1-monooxygenase